MASPDPFQQAFDAAKKDFLDSLAGSGSKTNLERSILSTTSIDEVYDAAEKLQEEQAKRGRMRNVARIMPFLDWLRSYAAEIEVFVQVKPEMFALIWGPIKLLLLWTSNFKNGFDAIANTIVRIADTLPKFDKVKEIMRDKARLKNVLALLYRDILDFYKAALELFSKSRLEHVFESMWPRCKDQIKEIETRIERHGKLLRHEVTFEHIRLEEEHRTKSMEAFQKLQEQQLRQRFQSLENNVCPRQYDDKLDWLRSRRCVGTAKSLAKEEAFTAWLDRSKAFSKILWLQGIPGAGKTFLASWAVDQAREKDQLALNDEHLQVILTESNLRDLKSNTKYAAEALIKALQFAGHTFLVIDGLDEIDDFESKQVLLLLLEILKRCPESRICLSSRVENDIDKTIGKQAITVRVDQKNSASIHSYVETRSEAWIKSSRFDKDAALEIQGLLFSVAVRANGMFLYARIVIDNVELLSDVDEIRSELKALPEDLDAAYNRILSRVNSLSAASRDKAKKILGWIGCAPVPLTTHELEQALLVKHEMQNAPRPRAQTPIVQLCGPIVEIVDDIPRFVHFSVKEYIFNVKVQGSIKMSEATRDLVEACWNYLSCSAFDEEMTEKEIGKNLVGGSYRFLNFALSNWFLLITTFLQLSKNQADFEALELSLGKLTGVRENYEFEEASGVLQFAEVIPLLKEYPDSSKFLSRAFSFYNARGQEDWTVDNADGWAKHDPLTVSNFYALVDKQLYNLLCPTMRHERGCSCAKLESHYGPRLHKCIFFSCPSRRTGFLSWKERKNHVEGHARPYKCRAKECDYAQLGFLTARAEADHWQMCRFNNSPKGSFDQSIPQEQEELHLYLFELVRSEKVEEMSRVWPLCKTRVAIWAEHELVKTAADMGSFPMVKFLLDQVEIGDGDAYSSHYSFFEVTTPPNFLPIIKSCLESGNKDLARYILRKVNIWGHRGYNYHDVVVLVMKTPSLDMSAVWLETTEEIRMKHGDHWLPSEILESLTLLKTASKYPLPETRMLEVWRKLALRGLLASEGEDRTLWLSAGLINVARSSYSVRQAAVLLEAGAQINGRKCRPWRFHDPEEEEARRKRRVRRGDNKVRKTSKPSGMTALHFAARNTSEEAANLMKFLLVNGADPNLGFGGSKPADEKGAKDIQRWLGMTWNELVDWASLERIWIR